MTPMLPWCAVCGRRVQSMVAEENFETCALEFVVSCHGATERVVVDREDIVEGARIEAGVAFGAVQIEAGRR